MFISVAIFNSFVALHSANTSRPKSRLGQAIDVVRRVMVEEDCKLRKGYIYKFIQESTATYVCFKSVRDYVMRIMVNQDVADALAGLTWEVIKLLKEPECRMIKQLKIDYNYIEVENGYFFDIWNKEFVKKPDLRGASPRAFVLYKYKRNRIPQPKYFIEGNSYFKY